MSGRKKKIYYAMTVEVKPLPGSQIYADFPGVKGAFFHAFVPAFNKKDVKDRLLAFLDENNLCFVKIIQGIFPFEQMLWKNKTAEKKSLRCAKEALKDDKVVPSVFNCWLKE